MFDELIDARFCIVGYWDLLCIGEDYGERSVKAQVEVFFGMWL